jgi:G:T/U-mismatch repair DNA glycosylase
MPEQHPFVTDRWLQNANNPLLEDKWFVNRNNAHETISFGFMPSREVKSIFLGTFPIWEIVVGPHANPNIEFFYGSVVNDFWNCLGFISGMPVNNLNNRIDLLDILNIGVTDILETIDRNPENCNADNCLTALRYNDMQNLKQYFPSLKNIFVTSGGRGPVGNIINIKNAATWLKHSVVDQNIQGFNKNGFVKPISINEVEFNLIYLFSPSNNANISIQGIINNNDNFGFNNLSIQEFRRLQWGFFIKQYHLEETANEAIDSMHNIVENNQELFEYFTN